MHAIREILTIQSDNMNQLDCIFNIYNKMGKKFRSRFRKRLGFGLDNLWPLRVHRTVILTSISFHVHISNKSLLNINYILLTRKR